MYYNKQKIAKSESRLNALFVLTGLRLLGGGLFLFIFFILQYSAIAETPFVESVQSLVRFENLLTGMVAAPDGSIYIAENDSGEITRIRTNNLYSTARFDTLMTGFTDPVGLAFTSDGRLLVGERASGRVVAVGNNQRETIINGLTDLASIRTDQLDNVYYVEMDPGRISRYSFRSNGNTLIQENLSYPADLFNFGRSLMTSELVDRTGVSGRVKMEPITIDQDPIPLPPIFKWTVDNKLIDPIRFVKDPLISSDALVSVRHVEKTIAGIQSPGAVYRINLVNGNIEGIFVDQLYGPTDMVANENGCLVLEEYAERISFFDWFGNRKILWDGLGAPTSFTILPNQLNRYLVAETVPNAGLSTVGSQMVRPVVFPEKLLNESIHGVLQTSKLFVSVTSKGEIIAIDGDGEYEVLNSQLFAPAKLLAGAGSNIWAYDLIGQISKIDSESGRVLQTANGAAIGIIDFDVEVNNESETVYALDSLGDIWLFTSIRNIFVPVSVLGLEFTYDYTNTMVPVFARVPGEGFVIAMNDVKGSIVWIDDDGEQKVVQTGFKQIVQLQMESRQSVTALSNRGWLRTIRLTYPSDISEPTSTPIRTPTPVAPTRTPTQNRPETPSPTPLLPTPTPTVATSILNWWIHDSK